MTGDYDPTFVSAVLEADKEMTPGPWQAWFTKDGDPCVTEEGQGWFGVVAAVSYAPDDYGTGNAEGIAVMRNSLAPLARRVMELEAIPTFEELCVALRHEQDANHAHRNDAAQARDIAKGFKIERDQLRERVAELEAMVDRLKDK